MSLACPFCGADEALDAEEEIKEVTYTLLRLRRKQSWGGFVHVCLRCGRKMKIQLLKRAFSE